MWGCLLWQELTGTGLTNWEYKARGPPDSRGPGPSAGKDQASFPACPPARPLQSLRPSQRRGLQKQRGEGRGQGGLGDQLLSKNSDSDPDSGQITSLAVSSSTNSGNNRSSSLSHLGSQWGNKYKCFIHSVHDFCVPAMCGNIYHTALSTRHRIKQDKVTVLLETKFQWNSQAKTNNTS